MGHLSLARVQGPYIRKPHITSEIPTILTETAEEAVAKKKTRSRTRGKTEKEEREVGAVREVRSRRKRRKT
jgi:hypothetical protein